MDVSQTAARQVFACALEASCAVADASDAFEDNVDERQQRVVELLQHEEYAAEVMFRSPFELSVMDKFEALLLKKKVLETRRFGDSAELCALLGRVGATFLKLDVTKNRAHYGLPSQKHIASLEQVAHILMTEAVDAILLHWDEREYQHYCTVARVDSGTVWTARRGIRDELRDLVQKSTLAQALTLLPGRARAACVSLVDSLRPISFVERCKIFRATAKTFNVPRGHVTVTDLLSKTFPKRSSDDVMQMMTVLQWFFGPEYPWFTAVRLEDKAKFDALCKNGKYPKVADS